MLAIFFGLIVLSVLLLRLCPIRPPPVRETFYGRATFAHACATANLQALRRDFAAGVRKLEGASTPVIYPEWFTQYVTGSPVLSIPFLTSPYRRLEADLDELGKRLNERALVLPFTELYNNAIRMRRQVKEARSEVNVRITFYQNSDFTHLFHPAAFRAFTGCRVSS